MFARGNIGDWLEGIVVLVFIAASLLGPIAKKLIEKFSPQKAEDESDAPRPISPPPLPKRRAPPARPVARPMPSSSEASGQRPPYVPPTTAPRPTVLVERIPSRPPQPRPVVIQTLPREDQQPPYSPPTARPYPSSADRHRKTDNEIQTRRTARRSRSKSSATEKSLNQLATVEDLGRRADAKSTKRRRSQPEVESVKAAAMPSSPSVLMPRLNPRTLRDAVVLSEILAPPVSLRPVDDRW